MSFLPRGDLVGPREVAPLDPGPVVVLVGVRVGVRVGGRVRVRVRVRVR